MTDTSNVTAFAMQDQKNNEAEEEKRTSSEADAATCNIIAPPIAIKLVEIQLMIKGKPTENASDMA